MSDDTPLSPIAEILQRQAREAPPPAPGPDGRLPKPRGPRDRVTTWGDLEAELDRWHERGWTATFWWRDDDAGPPTGALELLVGLAHDSGVPCGLLVTPDQPAAPGQGQPLTRLAAEIVVASEITVLQHGVTGANRNPGDLPPAELTDHGDGEALAQALGDGAFRLHQMFGDQAVPVVAPPWGRSWPGIRARLPGLGLRGLTGLGPRAGRRPLDGQGSAVGLVQANAHVALCRPERAPAAARAPFIGTAAALEKLLGHLRARRLRSVDPGEPTGLITHHQHLDQQAWEFLSELLAVTKGHPAARWLTARQVFEGRGGA